MHFALTKQPQADDKYFSDKLSIPCSYSLKRLHTQIIYIIDIKTAVKVPRSFSRRVFWLSLQRD